ALRPGVDLSLVDVTSGGGVLEEQGQRQSLVHVLGSLGVGVDDLLVADVVSIFKVFEIVVVQVWSRVVDTAQATFFADLDLGSNRVNRRGRVIDIGDRTCRWHSL